MATILFDVSSHGYGHLAISGPIIEKFSELFPGVNIVIVTNISTEIVSTFIKCKFNCLSGLREVNLFLEDALHANKRKSISGFEELYSGWPGAVSEYVSAIRSVGADAIVSNVNYLCLTAAHELALPSIALSCMNWLDIFRWYCSEAPHAPEIERLLYLAYAGSDLFLQTRPHMPMLDIPRRRSIGPIARTGRRRKSELRVKLRRGSGSTLVLYSLGGVPGKNAPDLPTIEGVTWLITSEYNGSRSDIFSCRDLRWPFADIVASVDAVVGKDSYGTVVEAACAGVPLVLMPRGNWPEEKYLVDWAQSSCCCVTTSPPASEGAQANLKQAVETVLSLEPITAVAPSGILEAIEAIATIAGV